MHYLDPKNDLTEIKDQSSEIPPELLEDPDIREAVKCLEESAFTPGELNTYEAYWDTIRTERTLINDSLAQGEQIVIAKGRQEGLEIALERLIQSGISKEDAVKMLNLP